MNYTEKFSAQVRGARDTWTPLSFKCGSEKATPPCRWKRENCIDLFGAQTDVYRWVNTKVCVWVASVEMFASKYSITSCSQAKSDIRHHSVGEECARALAPIRHTQTQRADLYRATFLWKLFRRASTNELFALARSQKMSHCVFGVGLWRCMHARTPIVPIMPKNASSAPNQSSCVGEIAPGGRQVTGKCFEMWSRFALIKAVHLLGIRAHSNLFYVLRAHQQAYSIF